MKKKLLFMLGIVSLILGTVGIFLPLLPTTPFLLLATYSFSKSSDRFYNYIINNRVFGKYIQDYRDKKGITMGNKVIVLIVLTLGIGYSMSKVTNIHMQVFLAVVFIGVTWHILKLKTIK